MAVLLRHYGAAKRFGGLALLQRTHAAEGRGRLVPRFMHTKQLTQRAPEEITRDIQRKQQDLRDAIAEGRRSLTAATNWRTQQGLFDAISEARMGVMAATDGCDEELLDKFKGLKMHQNFWEWIKLFFMVAEAIRKIIVMVFFTTVIVMLFSTGREVRKREKKREQDAKK